MYSVKTGCSFSYLIKITFNSVVKLLGFLEFPFMWALEDGKDNLIVKIEEMKHAQLDNTTTIDTNKLENYIGS